MIFVDGLSIILFIINIFFMIRFIAIFFIEAGIPQFLNRGISKKVIYSFQHERFYFQFFPCFENSRIQSTVYNIPSIYSRYVCNSSDSNVKDEGKYCTFRVGLPLFPAHLPILHHEIFWRFLKSLNSNSRIPFIHDWSFVFMDLNFPIIVRSVDSSLRDVPDFLCRSWVQLNFSGKNSLLESQLILPFRKSLIFFLS